MKKNSFLLPVIIITLLAGKLHAGIVNGKASLVIGQASFTESGAAVNASKLGFPSGIAIDAAQNRLFISDTNNNRILFWENASGLVNGQAADGVIGQPTFVDNAVNVLFNPFGICIDTASNLFVADSGNNRVLRYPYPQLSGMSADKVLGQATLTNVVNTCTQTGLTNPYSVSVDSSGGRIFVADSGNNRTLVYNTPLSSASTPAQIVLGQPDFTTPTAGTTQNTQSHPRSVFISSTTGSVFVADIDNSRVLKYTSPLSTQKNAANVLGQADFSSGSANRGAAPGSNTFSHPYSVSVIKGETETWVADSTNHRILRFDGALSNGRNASFFIGQPNFTANAPSSCSQVSLSSPTCVYFDSHNNLWVADQGNSRVLRFDAFTFTSVSNNRLLTGLPQKRITVSGTGIPDAGITVKLRKSGQTDIPGTAISYDSEQNISCSFDLTNAALGPWGLELSFTDAASLQNTLTLSGGCTVFLQTINSITPNGSASGSVVSATASGEGFPPGTVLSLAKQGQVSIIASTITVSTDEKQISGIFDLTGAATGYWNVYVATGNINTTLANGFFVSTSTLTTKYIDPAKENQISVQGPNFGTLLDISTGVFSSAVTITLSIPDISPFINQTELKSLNAYFDITNDQNLQPNSDITMTVSYTNGIVAGLDKTKFRVCLYSPATGRWAPVPSTAYPGSNQIVSTINHFSRYGLFQLVSAKKLGEVYVYPNPYRPDSNTIYDNPPLGRGIVFAGLPPTAKIKIFTISGELVKEIEESSADGTLLWDTYNADGQKVASGVYIYLVTSQDDPGKKTTGKFAIAE